MILFLIPAILLFWREVPSLRENMRKEFCRLVRDDITESFMPLLSFESEGKSVMAVVLQEQIESLLPFYGYLKEEVREERSVYRISQEALSEEEQGETESTDGKKKSGEEDGQSALKETAGDGTITGTAQAGAAEPGAGSTQAGAAEPGAEGTAQAGAAETGAEGTAQAGVAELGAETAQAGAAETGAETAQAGVAGPGAESAQAGAAELDAEGTAVEFVPHEQEREIDSDSLSDYETLLQEFYTVDANTLVGSDSLNAELLAGRDLTITKDSEGPQILIFHTHSLENFADSVPGDAATSIVGVGAHLAEILEDTYGYSVLHHTAGYDVEGRENAYARALPGVQEVLQENPSVQVVIDLHRDEVAEETRLVMDLDGRPTARFMFFNGLSRTKKTGDIAYLYNENLEGNLAFSFQMQKKAYEYYPGLTRKIYLKGYRYNMHLKERYLLVELGAQNNTVEEAMNACEPLAHILDLVLSGQ